MSQNNSSSSSSMIFETGHQDLIHDAQLDYYGRTLATASSDRNIRIFEIIKDKQEMICELQGHYGPVWRIAWSHPKYGNLLASCGYDRRLIIWKCNHNNNSQWFQYFTDDNFQSSVNCVAFAPVDLGLILIAGCADGTIHVYIPSQSQSQSQSQSTNNKSQQTFIKTIETKAHNGGVNGLSWSSQTNIANNNNNNNINTIQYKRFVSGGCDNLIKIWNLDNENKILKCENTLGINEEGHLDWIRDVCWAPIPGATSHSLIASGGEDKKVIIWKEKNKKWKKSYELNVNDKVWSVSWSELGNILAIAYGENQVQLYKESINGEWNSISHQKTPKQQQQQQPSDL